MSREQVWMPKRKRKRVPSCFVEERPFLLPPECGKIGVCWVSSRSGVCIMAITVAATYENGTLKLEQPLPLKEHEKVWLTIHAQVSRARQTAGLMDWTGDPALLERIALDPEFSILEAYDHSELERCLATRPDP